VLVNHTVVHKNVPLLFFKWLRETACIGLEQNIIDTTVSEWRKRLLACVRIVGKHCSQLKNGQLD